MAIDAELLAKMTPDDQPILHFYDWEGEAATYGYFLSPVDYLDLEKAEQRGLSLARRPTGGGIIFHVSDLAFSALVPSNFPHFSLSTLANYDFINQAVKRGVKTLFDHMSKGSIPNKERLSLLPEEPLPRDESCRHFCMAKPTQYDVMLGGRKVAGAAQRRQKQGYLHQGSIAIALPKEEFLNDILLPNTEVKSAMLDNTFSILGRKWTHNDLEEVRSTLKEKLKQELTR